MSNDLKIHPRTRQHHRAEVVRNITNIAKIYAEEALENIVVIMRKSDDENVRLKAAQLIIERAYGKPRQDVQNAEASERVRRVMEVEFLSARNADSQSDSGEAADDGNPAA